MRGIDFTALEQRLTTLLEALSDDLSVGERSEVEEFIEVGEYGVALETLAALLIEERKQIPEPTFIKIVELADAMGVLTTTIIDALQRRIVQG